MLVKATDKQILEFLLFSWNGWMQAPLRVSRTSISFEICDNSSLLMWLYTLLKQKFIVKTEFDIFLGFWNQL